MKRIRKKKKRIWPLIVILVLAAAAVVLLLLYLFVFSIRAIEIGNVVGEDGRYTFVRYEEDLKEQIQAELVADNDIASRKLVYSSDQPEVVEVSEDGLLTVRNPGEAMITIQAKFNPWVKAEFPIVVIQKAVRMEIAMPSEIGRAHV